MADAGRKQTDKELQKLEERIKNIYGNAALDVQQEIFEYFASFAKQDAELREKLEAGEITEEYYTQWRLNQIGRGERFLDLRDKLAERMTKANEAAIAYVNDATPGIYTLNRNYAAYEMESAGAGIDFTLYDESTVRRLIKEQPDLMPYYPEKKALKRGIDLEYGKKQITAHVTSGILTGGSMNRIAAALCKSITDMSVTSAIRAARTAVTAAENGGRTASYKLAADRGIELTREWIATKDARTRHSHGAADGQRVGVDEPFTVGGEKLMFPGDASLGATGKNLYNCRCTIKAMVKGHERTRETYEQWLERKQVDLSSSRARDDADALKFFGADARDNLKKIAAGYTIKLKNGFAAFPENDPLSVNIQNVKPLKTYFDVAMHGSPTAVGFGTKETNMSPRLLAAVIRHMDGWNGQKIRLLSCNTGERIGDNYCFAEELANALGVTVKAPDDVLYIFSNGRLEVGKRNKGHMREYKPNERGRRK